MSTPIKTAGFAMAIAAAGLFAVSGTATAGEGKKGAVHCYGVNSCKGHNDCKGEHNACKGQGSCKGMGFLNMSAKDCAKAGGKVKPMKKKKY